MPEAKAAVREPPVGVPDMEIREGRSLSVKELRGKAAAIGASSEDIDDARDSHDPQEALLALIQATEHAQAARLREHATVKELREHAAAVGVDGDAIEEARDGSDPRAALLLLIEHATAAGAVFGHVPAHDTVLPRSPSP